MPVRYSIKFPKNYSGYAKLEDPTGVRETTFGLVEGEFKTPALMGKTAQSLGKFDLKQYTHFRREHPWKEVDPTCVLYLPFDEGQGTTASDISGKQNHGTIYGATWKKLDMGIWVLEFDGVDDYVDCGYDASLNIIKSLTVEAWIWYDPAISDKPDIISKTTAAPPRQWNLGIRDDKLQFFIQSGDVDYTVTGATVLTKGWHHIAGIYDRSNVIVYLNGDLDNQASAVNLDIDSEPTIPVTIGRMIWHEYYEGLIALARVYNRALSAEEVAEHFEAEKLLFGL